MANSDEIWDCMCSAGFDFKIKETTVFSLCTSTDSTGPECESVLQMPEHSNLSNVYLTVRVSQNYFWGCDEYITPIKVGDIDFSRFLERDWSSWYCNTKKAVIENSLLPSSVFVMANGETTLTMDILTTNNIRSEVCFDKTLYIEITLQVLIKDEEKYMCNACAAGSFKMTSDSTPCLVCPAGTYSIKTESHMCTGCVANQYSSIVGADSDICQNCPANLSSVMKSNESMDCMCVRGFSAQPVETDISASPCVQCIARKYNSNIGNNADCIDCAAGQYSTAVGAVSDLCQACPDNLVSMRGSSELVNCICNAGYNWANGGTCATCAAGKF